jgi:hypothetical protein
MEVNWKKLYRIYPAEWLTVPKRGGSKRALRTSADEDSVGHESVR